MRVKQNSLRAMAKELGVSASYLSQVKNGKRPPSERLLASKDCVRLLTSTKTSVKQNVKHLLNISNSILPKTRRRGVAQPGSAPEWGSGGRRFKSAHPEIWTVNKPSVAGISVAEGLLK